MGIVRTLWKVVRRPMTRWWLRNGSWWLLGIVLVNFAYSYFCTSYSSNVNLFTNAPRISLFTFQLLQNALFIMPVILLVVAASVCDRTVMNTIEGQAAPMPTEFQWARYLLALGQIIPIAAVVIPMSILNNANTSGWVDPTSDYTEYFWIFTSPLTELASIAVSGTWLVLFIVLSSRIRLFRYGLLYAFLLASGLNIALISNLNSSWTDDQPLTQYHYSESIFLFLAALPLWLLLANSIKTNKFKLATVLHTAISIVHIGQYEYCHAI